MKSLFTLIFLFLYMPFAVADCPDHPSKLTIELRGTNNLDMIHLIFKHDGGKNYNGCLNGIYSLKSGFFGPTNDFFGDNISVYGGYLMIDIEKMQVWEGTQAQADADLRGQLKTSGGQYILYNPVDINLFTDDSYICVGNSSQDDCR